MDGTTVPVNVAVVGIGADDAATRTAAERLAAAGHEVIDSKQLAAGAPLLEVLTDWIEDDRIDVVLAIASDTEPVRAALAPLVSRAIPGFGELLRAAAFSEIGSAAMLLEGDAARCGATYVFVLPGTVGAVKVALEHLLLPQLDMHTRPLNLASRLPRLRGRAPVDSAVVRREREGTDPGFVPPKSSPSIRTPTPAPRVKTMPPPMPDKAPSKTPPLGVVLRATPVEPDAAKDAELITSDAAILIPPAVIVDTPETSGDAPAEIVDKPPAVEAAAEDKPKPEDTVAAEQLGAFVMSLEKHAAQVRREKSQVGPLPTAPAKTQPPPTEPRPAKTTPPPVKTTPPPVKRTDAELKALRDASVAEAISKVEKLPEKPASVAEPEPRAPRKKNETTPQQWAQAAEKLEKISPRATRDPGSLGPSSAVLGQGDRVIVIPQNKKRRTWMVLPLLLVVGAAGAFVVKTQFLSGNRTASAEPQPQPEHVEQTAQVESVDPVAAPVPPPSEPSDQPKPLPPVVPQVAEIEMDPNSGANLTAIAQAHADHHGTHAATPTPAPTPPVPAIGSAAPATGSADDAPDPRTHPNIAPASPDCDETSCILEHYQRECCARYKPAEMPAEKIDPNALPATLDKAAVKAGVADVKPAVQQCGEDHYAKGTVKITLTVNAAGQVTDATVSGSPDPVLGSCVADALKRATFAKTTNGAVFTYPFMF